MTFFEILLRSDEFEFDGRDEVEEPLEDALAREGLGEVTGGGSGGGYSNIDIEARDPVRALAVIRRVLQELRVGPNTVIRQYEPARRDHRVYEQAP